MRTVFQLRMTLVMLCVASVVACAQPACVPVDKMPEGKYTLASGDARLSIDPQVGGRILSLTLNGFEFLTGPEVMKESYGSTFWPSPQSHWNWPPPEVLDSGPYSASVKDDTLFLVSGKDNRTGLQVEKEFFAGKRGRFNIRYAMTNITDSVVEAAPWEISRVRKDGVFFFPVGNNPLGKKYFDPVPVSVEDGIAWYADGEKRPSGNLLTTAVGTEGWAAFAINGKLFLKKFPTVARANIAPGEGDIILYVSKEADYVEFEIQGEYEPLKPGERLSWTVGWIVVDIPDNIDAVIGNPLLVDFAREIVR